MDILSTDSAHIAVIVAGTNEPSNADFLAEKFIEGIHAVPGITARKIRLKDLHLEHFTLQDYASSHRDEDGFPQIRDLVLGSDAVVLASPIWNFSVPSHLKNLIDRMGAFGLDDTHSVGTLNSKPFYLILTGGSPLAAWPLLKRTTSHLPVAIQYFGGAVLGQHYEGRCMKGRGVFGLVVHERPRSIASVRAKGKAFGETVLAFRRTGLLPWKYRAMQKIIRLAQKTKRRLGL